MKLVKNRNEFVSLFPYKKSKPSKFPKKYPCLVEYEYDEGGLGGDYYYLKVIF